MRSYINIFLIGVIFVLLPTYTFPQLSYSKQVVKIPMRDGICLNTEIYISENTTESLPFLMTRTPYGQTHDKDGLNSYIRSTYVDMANEKYIFVFQDIRGRYESEGKFVMMRPPRDKSKPCSIDEGTDTYDTIEWLLKNIGNNNGKVGLLGISYSGWLTVMALLEPHPALAAVSPQASPSDMYIGDDFAHNGALRLSPAFGYAAMMETGNTKTPFQYDQYDTYEFFLDLGPLSNANKKYLNYKLPSWNNFMEHPDYDSYWKEINVDHYLTNVPMPVLNVAGWWDAEDFYGQMKIYETLEQYDKRHMNFLVVGPWRHGGWARDSGDKLGQISFEVETGNYFRKEIQSKWFGYFLKGKGEWPIREALTFQTGSNRWKEYKTWPPEEIIEMKKLYFHSEGKLSFEKPLGGKENFDSFISDPAKPVPYTKRPIMGFWQDNSSKALWKIEDQRFVHNRPDVLSWESDALKEGITVSGNIICDLFASTSGTDCDWVVKLIDVYPENYPGKEMRGYQLMIADEVFRAKYRNGFEAPEPVPANQIVEYKIDLNSRNHTFLEGHRIMVQVQSTWFPLIDRNPQKFTDIPKAKEEDYQVTEHMIFRSELTPSNINLPVSVDIYKSK